jgi:ABC-type Fe3+/spermidine/putrescine transport system ATPase subunit
MTLAARAITKRYGEHVALAEVSLELPAGRYTCVMGASGSGKTTLLRVLAGLQVQDSGAVTLDGRALDGVPAERRPIHTLFQDYALFPHLSVADNVAFAPRLLGVRGAALGERVARLMADVGLDMSLGTRKPTVLSGGEQQRVALARALAGEPRWLLLDEPLAALDRPLRAELRRLLHAVQRARGLGCLHVTHDPEEALALADTLVVMGDARVLAVGTPAELYARPPSLTVGRLLGELTRVPGQPGWLRPEHLRVGATGVPGTVRAIACLGDRWELEVEAAGQVHVARTAEAPAGIDAGAAIALSWAPERVLQFADARAGTGVA